MENIKESFGLDIRSILQKPENLLLKEAINTLFGEDELKVIMASDLTPSQINEYLKLEIFYHFIINDFVKNEDKLKNALMLKKKAYMLPIPKDRKCRTEIVDMVTDFRLQQKAEEYYAKQRR